MGQLFLDNSQTAQRIRSYASCGTISHAIILSGEGDKLSYAKLLAAAILCNSQTPPCGACIHCQKVENNIHPDLRIVLEEEKKELSVDTIREIRKDVYVRPNDSERKVYIFASCTQLNERDQNVLLKIVEEGPSYASFIFCAEFSGILLPTICSRCVEIKLQSQEALFDAESSREFIQVLCQRSLTQTVEYLISLETHKTKRETLSVVFSSAWCVTVEALKLKSTGSSSASHETVSLLSQSFSFSELNKLADILNYLANECNWNVGVGHVIGVAIAKLEEIIL